MITKKHLKLECLSTLVLDEAEDLLSSGFRNQLYEVFRALPSDVSALDPQEQNTRDGKSLIFLCFFVKKRRMQKTGIKTKKQGQAPN